MPFKLFFIVEKYKIPQTVQTIAVAEFEGKILLQKTPGAGCTGFERTDLQSCSLKTRDALQASKREKQWTVLPSCISYNSQCQALQDTTMEQQWHFNFHMPNHAYLDLKPNQ